MNGVSTAAPPSVTVVIVNYRTPALALDAARALASERRDIPCLRVVIVDGASGDGSAEILGAAVADPALADWVSVLPLAINGGFGWANNQAIVQALQADSAPDFIHILNPDTEIEPGAVTALAQVLQEHPRCAVVGSQLLNHDGSVSGSAFRFYSPGRELVRGARTEALGRLLGIAPILVSDGAATEVDWVTGASMMVRVDALRQAGLFDTGFFLYYEEVELMWRLTQAGWSVRHAPASRVRHIGGVATGMAYNRRDLAIRPPLPRYWFASRRRMFTLLYGRPRAALASVAWLAGDALYALRRALGRGGGHIRNRHEARDLLRYGIVPSREDACPSVARCSDPLGEPPAWMRDR